MDGSRERVADIARDADIDTSKLIKLLSLWDEDRSGRIDKAQFDRGASILFPVLSREEVHALYKSVEADALGTISLTELMSVFGAPAAPHSTSPTSAQEQAPGKEELDRLQMELHQALQNAHVRVIELFNKWDEDHSGSVSRKEFRKGVAAFLLLQSGGIEMSHTAADALFSRFDVDNSGEIEITELRRALIRGELLHHKYTNGKKVDGLEMSQPLGTTFGTSRGSAVLSAESAQTLEHVGESSDASFVAARMVATEEAMKAATAAKVAAEAAAAEAAKAAAAKAAEVVAAKAAEAAATKVAEEAAAAKAADDLAAATRAARKAVELKAVQTATANTNVKLVGAPHEAFQSSSKQSKAPTAEVALQSAVSFLRVVLQYEHQRLFEELHKIVDEDDIISRRDFRQAIQNLGDSLQLDLPRAIVDSAFNELDTKRVSVLSMNELSKLLSPRQPPDMELQLHHKQITSAEPVEQPHVGHGHQQTVAQLFELGVQTAQTVSSMTQNDRLVASDTLSLVTRQLRLEPEADKTAGTTGDPQSGRMQVAAREPSAALTMSPADSRVVESLPELGVVGSSRELIQRDSVPYCALSEPHLAVPNRDDVWAAMGAAGCVERVRARRAEQAVTRGTLRREREHAAEYADAFRPPADELWVHAPSEPAPPLLLSQGDDGSPEHLHRLSRELSAQATLPLTSRSKVALSSTMRSKSFTPPSQRMRGEVSLVEKLPILHAAPPLEWVPTRWCQVELANIGDYSRARDLESLPLTTTRNTGETVYHMRQCDPRSKKMDCVQSQTIMCDRGLHRRTFVLKSSRKQGAGIRFGVATSDDPTGLAWALRLRDGRLVVHDPSDGRELFIGEQLLPPSKALDNNYVAPSK